MHIKAILVTGCAGDIGLSVSKILREIDWIEKVYGCDSNDQFPYFCFYDEFKKVPKVSDENYLSSIENLIREYNIELIIPASEPELRYFCLNNITKIGGAPLIMPSFNIMELGFDKLKTSLYLKNNGYPYPWTRNVMSENPVELPCIIKSRTGSGSKTINLVNESNLGFFKSSFQDYIFQELLLPDDEEYTCGVFKSKNKDIHSICFKRTLAGGRTGYAEVVENKSIDNMIYNLSKEIDFYGSINIQLRLTEKGPTIFEINPRFSSTVFFRHKLGFEDVKWSILDFYGKLSTNNYRACSVGKKIFRSDNEIIY